MDGKYINLQTDFGFKKIFGSDCNKDLLMSLLKALIPERQDIKDIKYLNTEYQGDTFVDRRAIFDVYCESEDGDHFIVEMQNASQAYFKDRAVFHSTFPIRDQAPKGCWDFKLSNVYTIGLLNFEMDDDSADPDEVRHEVKLMNTKTKRVFYDKLTLIYVIIPRFRKTEEQLETLFDKWMFVLKNMSELTSRPERLQERVFKRLFQAAEIAAYSPEELNSYLESVKAMRDMRNVLDFSKEEGHAEGLAEGLRKGREEGYAQGVEATARRLLAMGLPTETVADATGLSLDEVNRMKVE